MRWPSPCCGRLTLPDGPGRYELCPVCSYEDDLDQLRWPLVSRGANGASLVECQQAYARTGHIEEPWINAFRNPTKNERLDEAFRPFDPQRDWTSPVLPGGRWPLNFEALYWWRPTYWNGQQDKLPAPSRERTSGDDFAEELLRELPEAYRVAERLEWTYGEAHPWRLIEGLADLAIESPEAGNVAFADRVAAAMEAELARARGNDSLVRIAFLGRPGWHKPGLRDHQDTWPPLLRTCWEEARRGGGQLYAPSLARRLGRRLTRRSLR